MRVRLQGLICIVILLSLDASAFAQDNTSQRSAARITASATADRVRFTAPASVVQIRLEVYNSAGKKLFDNEVRGGNVLDWHLQDGQAEPLADDAYVCAITVKGLSGRIEQKLCSVIVDKSQASVRTVEPSQLSTQQSEAIGPVEESSSLIVMKEGDNQTTTIIAHNGDEGQITRGKGALSFRIGDFYRGVDSEQMRLTTEGNLGIGITHPQVRLEVDGFIRATQGIVFPDGTIQYSASSKTLGARSTWPDQGSTKNHKFHTEASGTGTQGQIAKWTDNGGTLGDSVISEVGGNVGIGTNNPQSGLDYRSAGAAFFTRDFPTNPGNAVSALQLGLSNAGSRNVGVGPSFLFFGENTAGAKSFLGRVSGVWENPAAGGEAGAIFFQVRANSGDINALTERMRITSSGKVGIGTQTPSQLMHLAQNGDYQLRLENPGGGGGFWNIGQADNSFHSSGGKLLFVPGTIESTNATVVFTNSGNVGIGTINPTISKLVVNDSTVGTAVAGITSTSGSGLFGQSTGAGGYGVYGTANGWGVYGISTTSTYAGVYGTTNAVSGIGVYAKATASGGVGVIAESAQGFAISARGNARQDRDKGGWVKAMVYLDRDGNIVRCYNALTGASSGGCGFTTQHPGLGGYYVNFNFQIDDRFIVVTAEEDIGATAASTYFVDPTTVSLSVHYITDGAPLGVGANTDAPCFIIIF